MNELVVKPANVTPAIVEVPGVDELEQYVDGMLATYKKTPVSAETLTQAKQARTDLNKAYKGLSETRRNIADKVAGNWPDTEKRLKEIEKKIQSVSDGTLKPQIDEVVEAEKQARKTLILSEIEKIATEYSLPAEKIQFDDKWLNKTAKWVDTEQAVRAQFENIKSDVQVRELQMSAIEAYAAELQMDPTGVAGYVGQLDYKSVDEVKATMNKDVKLAKARFAAERARAQADFDAKAKRAEQATKIGNKLVDKETGEIIEEPEALKRTYIIQLSDITDQQFAYVEQFIHNKFDKGFEASGVTYKSAVQR
ncbi:DUF1351 domain-containing protein [Weissella cibaria]|nr:DUF1351 domain-containing protein [Weissella cibaria]